MDMDKLVSLCKRRGFIFPSSEIYGGINGFWDYGPLGVELKRNIKDAWWRDTITGRDDVVGLDCSIIMHPKVWEASGHVGGFSDPMVDCRATKERYRADQLFVGIWEHPHPGSIQPGAPTHVWLAGLGATQDDAIAALAKKAAKILRVKPKDLKPVPDDIREYLKLSPDDQAKVGRPISR